MKRMTFFTILAFAAIVPAADAQTVTKSYSYFTVGGTTLEELDKELYARGPRIQATGRRHPGATQMQFSSRITYASTDRWCRVDTANVSVKAKIILPRWGQRKGADGDTRLVWDTLSSDIKRHEESHVQIAKQHARELEQALKGLGRRGGCDALKREAAQTSERILARHDEAQARFDRVEAINFENRMMRLLSYRLERDKKAARN